MPHPPSFKTRAMARIEKSLDQPLETFLEQRYRTSTTQQIADELGVSTAAITAWMKECGIELRFPGQRPPEAVSA